MKDTQEKIYIMNEYLDGVDIEFKHYTQEDWKLFESEDEPVWNWVDCDYRVKKEPLTIWVNYYPNENDVGGAYLTKEDARNIGTDEAIIKKFIEVIDGD
jgi:hypothetical protein